MIRPKKHLGQHFLTDLSIEGRIVDALNTGFGDTVLEIGPGTGVLTGLLLEKEIQLLPVEIDSESVIYLKHKWPVLDDLIIEKGKIAKILPPGAFKGKGPQLRTTDATNKLIIPGLIDAHAHLR